MTPKNEAPAKTNDEMVRTIIEQYPHAADHLDLLT